MLIYIYKLPENTGFPLYISSVKIPEKKLDSYTRLIHTDCMNKTLLEIASDWSLWQEHADPSGLDTREEWENRSIDDRIQFLKGCGFSDDPELENGGQA